MNYSMDTLMRREILKYKFLNQCLKCHLLWKRIRHLKVNKVQMTYGQVYFSMYRMLNL
uniref:Alternative protein VPS13B n=1 Tax=Homo sapiens TaxID=9606 RepID=L8EAQ4_HUMAN|nr:alternative protein VPS13B [Homo sapiens]